MSTHHISYAQLLHRLETSALTRYENGVETVIKPIPDSDTKGTLDPRVLDVVLRQRSEEPATEAETAFSIEAIRAQMGWPNQDVTTSVIRTQSLMIGERNDIPVRVYAPEADGLLPGVLFFHGGGFFGGDLDTVEHPCKALAEKANAVVVSVDYRLAPEDPFPAGLEDCFEAVKWVHRHAEGLGIAKEKIAVAGDSAGGNFAAVCAILDQEQGTDMIKYQALIYPVVNLGSIETDDYRWSLAQYDIREHDELIRGIVLSLGESADLFNDIYLQGKTDVTNPFVSPLFHAKMKGLPAALIVTAEYDYLRLEGEAYARKLARAGVETRIVQYRGMDHAFIDKLGEYPQAEDCMNEIAKGLRRVFG